LSGFIEETRPICSECVSIAGLSNPTFEPSNVSKCVEQRNDGPQRFARGRGHNGDWGRKTLRLCVFGSLLLDLFDPGTKPVANFSLELCLVVLLLQILDGFSITIQV
jgi:hypothetical protein